jgi:hypothetical protein
MEVSVSMATVHVVIDILKSSTSVKHDICHNQLYIVYFGKTNYFTNLTTVLISNVRMKLWKKNLNSDGKKTFHQYQ